MLSRLVVPETTYGGARKTVRPEIIDDHRRCLLPPATKQLHIHGRKHICLVHHVLPEAGIIHALLILAYVTSLLPGIFIIRNHEYIHGHTTVDVLV